MLLVLLIPICGMVGIAQILVLVALVPPSSRCVGTLLATNLALHILMRHMAPQMYTYLAAFCTDGRSYLFTLSFPKWFRYLMIGDFGNEAEVPPPPSLGIVSCHNLHLNVVAVIGHLCSFLLLIVAQVM